MNILLEVSIGFLLYSTIVKCSPITGCSFNRGHYIFPMAGAWYKDNSNGKYYFKQGNVIYLQRNDGYYSKWIARRGTNYVLNDNYKWTWDRMGRFFHLPTEYQKPIEDNQRFGIPVNCLGGNCPDQLKFPTGGLWSYTNSTYYYEVKGTIYELSENGFYRKWSARHGRCFQICPDWWTWDIQTGFWESVPNSEVKFCNYNDPPIHIKPLMPPHSHHSLHHSHHHIGTNWIAKNIKILLPRAAFEM